MNKLNEEEKSHKENYFDILRQLERLTEEINNLANKKGKLFFHRYPITFALLALFGLVILSEAIKQILKSIGIFNLNPLVTLLIGLTILILTGTVYKKLNK